MGLPWLPRDAAQAGARRQAARRAREVRGVAASCCLLQMQVLLACLVPRAWAAAVRIVQLRLLLPSACNHARTTLPGY